MVFNWVDYIFLAIFVISILGGFMRGGVREIMALFTWIAAFVIAGLFARPLASAFSSSESVQSTAFSSVSTGAVDHVSMLALGISFAALFFGTILIGFFLGYLANRVVEGVGISVFNRLLGGIFGLARGYLVNLFIVFIVQLSPLSQQSAWAKSSLVPSFEPTAQWLGEKIQPGFESLKSKMGKTIEDMTSQYQNQ